MLDQDSSLYLISSNIFITCLLNNVWYYEEKFQGNHFCELKGLISSIPNPLARDFWLHVQKSNFNFKRRVFFLYCVVSCKVASRILTLSSVFTVRSKTMAAKLMMQVTNMQLTC